MDNCDVGTTQGRAPGDWVQLRLQVEPREAVHQRSDRGAGSWVAQDGTYLAGLHILRMACDTLL